MKSSQQSASNDISRSTLEREPDIALPLAFAPHTYRPHRHATRELCAVRAHAPPLPHGRTYAHRPRRALRPAPEGPLARPLSSPDQNAAPPAPRNTVWAWVTFDLRLSIFIINCCGLIDYRYVYIVGARSASEFRDAPRLHSLLGTLIELYYGMDYREIWFPSGREGVPPFIIP